MNNKKIALVIMDGWGLGKDKKSDAIQNANVPFVSSLYSMPWMGLFRMWGQRWLTPANRQVGISI